jgi:very-short-patch-repair endonuclease
MHHKATRNLVSSHGATRSFLEELLLDLSTAHGLPEPKINAEVHGVEVDFYYPPVRRVIEADGYSFHFTKIAFEDDHERRLYLEAKGERVTPVDYKQVTKGRATTARQLLTILQRADSSARP